MPNMGLRASTRKLLKKFDQNFFKEACANKVRYL
jgi:hypothetical protein